MASTALSTPSPRRANVSSIISLSRPSSSSGPSASQRLTVAQMADVIMPVAPYYEPLSVAVDKSSQLDPTSLVERISEIIEEMHEDGTMVELSEKWYGTDLTVAPRKVTG